MQNDFDYRFSSEAFDTETGLSYYNYRYYSPELGRWLSRDPIEERGGVNLYAMTSNDLVNKYDINGLSSATLTASHQGTGHASVEAKPSWWEAYIWEQGPGANWDKMRRYASVYSKFTSTSTSASVFQFGHTEMPYSSYHLQMSSGVNIYLSVTNDSCKCCKINISSNTNAVDSGTPTGGYRTLAQYTGPDSICVKIGETKKIGQLIVGFGWDHYNTDGSTFVSASASASVSVSCAE
jgi:RHS repeat-associated protein